MKKIWKKIDGADTGSFESAKKVELKIPLKIDGKELDFLYVAQGMHFKVGAFENKSTKSELFAEAQTENQLIAELIEISDNYKLEILKKR